MPGLCSTEQNSDWKQVERARMPVKVDVVPPPPANSKQPGVTKSLLYNGSRFQGSQKSKGNSYDVEVVLQVSLSTNNCAATCLDLLSKPTPKLTFSIQLLRHKFQFAKINLYFQAFHCCFLVFFRFFCIWWLVF